MFNVIRILVCLIGILLCPCHCSADWEFNTKSISREQWAGGFRPLGVAIDGSGFPHFLGVGYEYQMGNSGNILMHYYFTGKRWKSECISYRVGDVAFAIDSHDRKHLIYQEMGFGEWCMNGCPPYYTMHFYDDGSGWTATQLGTWDMNAVSMVVDRSDIPHIAFSSRSDLKHAQYTGDQWITETLPDDGTHTGAGSTSIAVTGSGAVYVAYVRGVYYPETSSYIRLANNRSGTWEAEVIGSGFLYKMVLDSLERPHVLWGSPDNDHFLLSSFDGTQWITRDVLDSLELQGGVLPPAEILPDSSGGLNLFFIFRPDKGQAESTGTPVHAHFDGTHWVKEFLDPSVKDHMDLSAVQRGKTTHLLYAEKFNGKILKCKWAHASGLKLITVQATGSAGNSGKFSIIRTGNLNKPLRISYLLNGTGLLRHSVVIPAGSSSVNVHPGSFHLRKNMKRIKLTLLPKSAYRIAIPSSAILPAVGNR